MQCAATSGATTCSATELFAVATCATLLQRMGNRVCCVVARTCWALLQHATRRCNGWAIVSVASLHEPAERCCSTRCAGATDWQLRRTAPSLGCCAGVMSLRRINKNRPKTAIRANRSPAGSRRRKLCWPQRTAELRTSSAALRCARVYCEMLEYAIDPSRCKWE